MDNTITERLRVMTHVAGPGPEAALRRLAVFRGGFTYEAARALLGLEQDRAALDRILAALYEHSFVSSQAANGRGTRYTLDPAAEAALQDQIDNATRQAHYAYFLALARDEGAKLDDELPNLEAAFEWALESGDGAAAYWLYHACGAFLLSRGLVNQNRDWLRRSADALPPDAGSALLGAVYNSVGVAYQNDPEGDPRVNLRQAIAAYQDALAYHTPDSAPLAYAVAQHNLGTAYADLAHMEDPLENLWMAVNAYKEALLYRTPDSAPTAYAATQMNLALAYREMAGIQNRKDNLLLALNASQEALRIYTPTSAPQDYAAAHNNLGNTYRALASVERPAEYLRRAIAAYTEALRFRTPDSAPLAYAATQNNLGTAYRALSDYEDQSQNLQRAINAFREALHYPIAPLDQAATHNNLGMAYHALAQVTDRAANLQRAIDAYHEALLTYTPDSAPLQYAKTQANLGTTHDVLGDWASAIACWKEAARYFQDMGAVDQARLMQEWILGTGKTD